MIKQSDSPSLELERAFAPEYLRQLPNGLLLVPQLLRCQVGRPSLHLVSNGRGEEYYLLQIHTPSPSGGRGTETSHYIGRLDERQLSLLKSLINRCEDERLPSGAEQLRRIAPTMDRMSELRDEAMRIARDHAQPAGFSLRGYVVNRRKDARNSPCPPPKSTPAVEEPSTVLILRNLTVPVEGPPNAPDDPSALTETVLNHLRRTGPTDPHSTLEDALFVARTLNQSIADLLDEALRLSALQRVTAIAQFGRCRPLSKNESRALVRLRRTQAIGRNIDASLEKIRSYRRTPAQ